MAAPVFSQVSEPAARERKELSLALIKFADLRGFACDDHLEAFQVFARSCAKIAAKSPSLRKAAAASAGLEAIAHEALRISPHDGAEAREFFETHFTPCPVSTHCTEE